MSNKRFNEKLFKTYNKYSKDHKKDVLKEKTYYSYLGDASAFLNSVIVTKMASIKTKKELKVMLDENHRLIMLSLKSTAYSKTSDSWRKLRRALTIMYRAAGLSEYASEVAKLDNPAPVSDRSHNTKKSRRLVKVTDDVMRDIIKHCQDNNDQDSLDLIVLAKCLGIRPSEAERLQLINNDGKEITVKIHGSKKTLIGERNKSKARGLDRTLTVAHNASLQAAIDRARDLDELRIKAAQMRLHRASRKIFDTTEKHFCLYSLRYTFGSNLKRQLYQTEGGRIVAAAIMGHKNTSSISSYGHFRSGSVSAEIPQVDADTIAQVKDNIGERFGKAGQNFDIGEAIRNRDYIKTEPSYSP
ncbi:site-specific integrase [Billgrantia antri]|uniref:Site-specific integrase n=1 Tax=Halomonas sulfidivorans TaxID=2733488 RepID=A0ABX7WGR9_9GAMM|nr:site-specific integrase [Halomonas sulfidivorans]QTP59568.1 site-specific integrase [Halomonas sulfidivorans]